MKSFFAPNISGVGRWLRGLTGLACLGTGLWLALKQGERWGWLLAALGLFMGIEALRGWCLLRACGVRTKF